MKAAVKVGGSARWSTLPVAWTVALALAMPGVAGTRARAETSVRVTLDLAIQLALQHNKALLATRTTIEQSQHNETTAGLRPNPQASFGWSPVPLFKPSEGLGNYLKDATGVDVALSYTLERGGKRGERLRTAKDATGLTRWQVSDSERALSNQVASQFVNVQLAESTLALAKDNLESFQKAAEIGEAKFKGGGISENDFLKIKLQLLQFQTDVEQAQLARAQGLADLRQLMGYDTVPADYDVEGTFDYQPLSVRLDGLQTLAVQNRPDLRAAEQSVVVSKSQYTLAIASGKQDVTVSADVSHAPLGGGTTANTVGLGISIPLAIFNRNQGEISRTRVAVTQAELQEQSVRGQVMTDVRDAYEGLQQNDRIAQYYRGGYLEISKKSRDISEFAYRRGATALFDFLDAERSYRATQLSYRKAIAAYLLSVEQVRQAVGTRRLP